MMNGAKSQVERLYDEPQSLYDQLDIRSSCPSLLGRKALRQVACATWTVDAMKNTARGTARMMRAGRLSLPRKEITECSDMI